MKAGMNRRGKVISVIILVVVIITAGYVSLSYSSGQKESFIVYSADAYVPEVNSLLSSFHNYSGIATSPVKGGGSYVDASEISMGSPASVFISVSLQSYGKSYLGNYSSGWALAFAADQIVLAYSSATLSNPYAKSIISQFNQAVPVNNSRILSEAFSNLSSGKVKVGISNPLTDPAGVRAWLTMQMAGFLYHNGNSSYFSSLMVGNGANYTSSNAAELVSPLTEGQIQFLFIYKSSAITHGLKYVTLPDAVNQGNTSDSGFYSQFSYTAGGKTTYGSPILLFVSIINNGTAHSESEKFVSYLINNTEVFANRGLVLQSPMLLYGNADNVPAVTWGLSNDLIRSTNQPV